MNCHIFLAMLALSSRRSAGLIQSILCALLLLAPVNALYFYLDNTTPKCFFEELPKGTLVVGHFNVEHYNSASNSYVTNEDVNLLITVTEVFDNDHAIVTQKGKTKGKFTFTAGDSGEHRICFAPNKANRHGGQDGQHDHIGSVKLTVDLAIGETSKIEAHDQGKIDDIVQKVRDLNLRLQDVRREQVFQREREAEFRDQSESTNARVVRWTTIQLIVLGVTCAWQLSHLRSFFIKQKLT